MKKIALFTIVAAVVTMMAACGGKTEKVPFDNGDSADVANEANKIKYSYEDTERKNGLFVFISERIKAFFMNIKL